MELNASIIDSLLEKSGQDKGFLKNLASFTHFMYDHMIYIVGIPQMILNLMVVVVIIYSSKVSYFSRLLS